MPKDHNPIFSKKEVACVQAAANAYTESKNSVGDYVAPKGYRVIEVIKMNRALGDITSQMSPAELIGKGLNPSSATLYNTSEPWICVINQNVETRELLPAFRGTKHWANITRDWPAIGVNGDLSREQRQFVNFVDQQITEKFPGMGIEAVTGHSAGSHPACELGRLRGAEVVAVCAPSMHRILDRCTPEQLEKITVINSEQDYLINTSSDGRVINELARSMPLTNPIGVGCKVANALFNTNSADSDRIFVKIIKNAADDPHVSQGMANAVTSIFRRQSQSLDMPTLLSAALFKNPVDGVIKNLKQNDAKMSFDDNCATSDFSRNQSSRVNSINRSNNGRNTTMPNANSTSSSQTQMVLHQMKEIYKSQQLNQIKVAKIMDHVRTLHKDMQVRRVEMQKQRMQEQSLANFRGIEAGFGMIQRIGQESDNKSLQLFGGAGMAVTQGMLGFAQLTGTFGMTAVTGLSMITPVTAIIGGVLTIASLFRHNKGKKQAKAMQKQFHALSTQIAQMHNGMYKGFVGLNENLQHGFETTNENLRRGLEAVDVIMQQHFEDTNKYIYQNMEVINDNMQSGFGTLTSSMQKGFEEIIHNQEVIFNLICDGFQSLGFEFYKQSFVLSNIDEKLGQILSQIQQLGLKYDERDRAKLYQMAERFDSESKPSKLAKILQKIQQQLRIASTSFTALDEKGNNLPGWYHLQSFIELFKYEDFQQYDIDIKNLLNLDWAELSLDAYVYFIPYLMQQEVISNPVVHEINKQVLSTITRTVKPTADFIRVISSQEFLQRFFNHYISKLNKIKNEAEKFLNPIASKYSKDGMQRYALDMITKYSQQTNADFTIILNSISGNSQSMVSQIGTNNLMNLEEKVAEYNYYVTLFKFHVNILFSILDLNIEHVRSIKLKLDNLVLIPESYYFLRDVAEVKNDPAVPNNPSYHYLNMNMDSKFVSCNITAEEINQVHQHGIEHSDYNIQYLQMIALFASASSNFREGSLNDLLHTYEVEFSTNEQKPNSSSKIFTRDIPTTLTTQWPSGYWYRDDDINALLQHYANGHADVEVLTTMPDTGIGGRNDLCENLHHFQSQRANGLALKNKIIIPVNINLNHWVLLYCIYDSEQSTRPNVYYFDPLAKEITPELLAVATEVFENLNVTIINHRRVQINDDDCGPWIIEVAKAIMKGTGIPDIGQLDVPNARKEHERIVKENATIESNETKNTDNNNNNHSLLPLMNFQQKQLINKGEKLMQNINMPQNIGQIIELMQPVFKVAETVRNEDLVYVIGVTGDGKSTLINYLNGSDYRKVWDDKEGDDLPQLVEGSVPEVCKVGKIISTSETVFPKLVKVTNTNGSLCYCDLPGTEETRVGGEAVCGAYAPKILHSKAKSVKGIVWVINYDQFKTTKAKNIKKVLRNLLNISKNDPETIANSITFIVRGRNEKLASHHILNLFNMVIDQMKNNDEKTLLQTILEKINLDNNPNNNQIENNRIIISDIFDTTGKNRNKIHDAILRNATLTPQDKNRFDFDHYCDQQTEFNRILTEVIEHKQAVEDQLATSQVVSSELRDNLENKRQEQRMLAGEITNVRERITGLDQELIKLQTTSQEHQAAIDSVNNNNVAVRIGDIKHSIDPMKIPKQVQVPTGETQRVLVRTDRNVLVRVEMVQTGTRPVLQDILTAKAPGGSEWACMDHRTARKNMAVWKSSMEAQGYTVTEEWRNHKRAKFFAKKDIYTKEPIMTPQEIREDVPIYEDGPTFRTETVYEPAPGSAEYIISDHREYPVEISLNEKNKDWTIKPDTETKKAGYQATAKYDLGKGCIIDLAVSALKKHTPEGKAIIAEHQTAKTTADQAIREAQRDRSALSETSNLKNSHLTKLQAAIADFQKHKDDGDARISEIDMYLQSNQATFNAVVEINGILNGDAADNINPARVHVGLFNVNNQQQHKAANADEQVPQQRENQVLGRP